MGSYSYAADQTGDRKDALTSEKSAGRRTLWFSLPIDRKKSCHSAAHLLSQGIDCEKIDTEFVFSTESYFRETVFQRS